MVIRARSISDFSHTVSCDRLPQRMAARIDRSCFTCATSSSRAWLNFFWMDTVVALIPPALVPPFYDALDAHGAWGRLPHHNESKIRTRMNADKRGSKE